MQIKQRAGIILATTLGSGYSPFAPGTVGALIAAVVLWVVPPVSWSLLLALSVLVYLLGVRAAQISDQVWQTKDCGRINWDEVLGMMVTFIAVPKSALVWCAGFLLFRFFDILKPFPVRQAERLPHGWGVMTDDLLAGIYSNIVLQVVFRLLF